MKLPSGETIGYGLIAVAALIAVGLIVNAYIGPNMNAERDRFWMKRAIGCAAFGGALVVRSRARSTVTDSEPADDSPDPEGRSPDQR